MLRRLKSEVETKLPPRRETKVVCPLAHVRVVLNELYIYHSFTREQQQQQQQQVQRRLYRQILMREKDLILNAVENKKESSSKETTKFRRLRNLMMQLRKCCCHPFLFPAAEDAVRKENASSSSSGAWDGACDETIVSSSGKMMMLDRILARLKLKGHRVVIFSQFTRVLDIVDDYLNMRGYDFARLDGSTNRVQRMVRVIVL